MNLEREELSIKEGNLTNVTRSTMMIDHSKETIVSMATDRWFFCLDSSWRWQWRSLGMTLTVDEEGFSSSRGRFASIIEGFSAKIRSRCLRTSFKFGHSSVGWMAEGARIEFEQNGVISSSNGQSIGWSSFETDSNSPWLFLMTCHRFK